MRSVAFLRAINVGGRRVTNDELSKAFIAMGFADVATFLASGNVLFTPSAQPSNDATTIADGLRTALGFEVPTTIRDGEAMAALACAEPFTEPELARGGKPQTLLLFDQPTAAKRKAALALGSDTDRLVFGDRVLHWLPRVSVLENDLDLKAIDKHLGTNTMRTANTIRRLAAKI